MLPAAALLVGSLSASPPAAAAETVRVAVAANFTEAAREVSDLFRRETGHRTLLSSGSTGLLYAQILRGAPFEVFLAADEERPALAESAGLAVPGSRFTYAVGRLALYSREPGRITGPESLRSPPLARLALPNPETAPYGRAALEVLERLGLGGAAPFQLVRGTNVAQAYQFVRTGNADAGFVALAQVGAGGAGGSHWVAPEEMHSPIRQQAVLLEAGAGNPAASGFLRFLKSAPVREVLRRRGYRAED